MRQNFSRTTSHSYWHSLMKREVSIGTVCICNCLYGEKHTCHSKAVLYINDHTIFSLLVDCKNCLYRNSLSMIDFLKSHRVTSALSQMLLVGVVGCCWLTSNGS